MTAYRTSIVAISILLIYFSIKINILRLFYTYFNVHPYKTQQLFLWPQSFSIIADSKPLAAPFSPYRVAIKAVIDFFSDKQYATIYFHPSAECTAVSSDVIVLINLFMLRMNSPVRTKPCGMNQHNFKD